MAPAEKVAAGSPRTQIIPETLNLNAAERQIVEAALTKAGSIVEAAELCGVTRHHLKRLIIKHKIEWPRASKAHRTPTRSRASLSASTTTPTCGSSWRSPACPVTSAS